MPSSRAAILTPSPRISSLSTTTSPRLNPNPEFDPPFLDKGGLARGSRPLHCDRTAYRVDDAGELDEYAVAGGLKDTAAVFGNCRIDQFAA